MKKLTFIALLLLTLIPSVSLAVWWNPFTWVNKVETIETPSQYVPTPTISDPEVLGEVSPTVITGTQIVEKIVEKPIIQTKTITVQDPALQAKIDTLVAENTSLKVSLATLQKSNKSLSSNLLVCEPLSSTVSNECLDAKEANISTLQAIDELTISYQQKINLITQNSNGTFAGAIQQEIQRLQNEMIAKKDLLEIELAKVISLVNVECN